MPQHPNLPGPAADDGTRAVSVDGNRVIERLGARIGQLEAEKAQLEDVIRQLMTRATDTPRPAAEESA